MEEEATTNMSGDAWRPRDDRGGRWRGLSGSDAMGLGSDGAPAADRGNRGDDGVEDV